MSIPREPRQKMINIMYLVLTAMLALNVASEILNAFKTVDNSLRNSNSIITTSTDNIMNSLKAKVDDNQTSERAKPWYERALKVQNFTRTLYSNIENYKRQIMIAAGADSTKINDSTEFKQDNLEAATRLMVKEKRGDDLRKMLDEYKTNVLNEAKVDPKLFAELSASIPIDTKIPKTKNTNTWSTAYFNMTPAIAAITILSKFQNDIKNTESQVISKFHEQVGAVIIVYDEFKALIGTNATYLMPNQKLEVKAGIGAYSKAVVPRVSVNGSSVAMGPDGYAVWSTDVKSPGSYNLRVRVDFTKPDGTPDFREEVIPYVVGSPSGAAIMLDKMNVFYIGVDNPITISSGTGWDKTDVKFNGQGSMSGQNGSRVIKVTGGTDASITVTAEGKSSTFNFRVKRIPDPKAIVGNFTTSRVPSAAFKQQGGVRAILENFDFDAYFTVVSYKIGFNGAGFPDYREEKISGPSWEAVRNLINQCKPGSNVFIDDIKVQGPDGTIRTLPSLGFTLY